MVGNYLEMATIWRVSLFQGKFGNCVPKMCKSYYPMGMNVC